MKQLNIFDCSPLTKSSDDSSHTWHLFVDGASRNNPGQSGAGVYLLKDNVPVYQEGFYLGIKTNNEAEYLALLIGIFISKTHLFMNDILYIVSDSQLMIKQMKGEYKVKKPMLQQFHAIALTLLDGFNYSFCHVLRDNNVRADSLANKGVEKKGSVVPYEFIGLMQSHGIEL